MLIVWRGFGIVVPVIGALALGAANTVAPGRFAAPAAALVVGPALWLLGRRMNAGGTRHTFYFVPVQYWGPVFAALSVALFVADST